MSNVPPPPIFHNKPLPVHDENTEALLVTQEATVPAFVTEPVLVTSVVDEDQETNFDSSEGQHSGFQVEKHTQPAQFDTVEVVRQPVPKKDLKEDDSPFTTVVVEQSKKGLILKAGVASVLLISVVTFGTLVLTNVIPLFS